MGAVEVVDPEHGHPLRLERDLERVLRDDHAVAGVERVRAEPLREHLDHLGLASEGHLEGGRPGRPGAWPDRDRRRGHVDVLVAPDVQRRQVRRHGLGLLVHPGRAAPSHPAGVEPAVGHHVVARRRGDPDPERRLLAGQVVAREPGGGAARLARHEDAVGELLPTHRAPGRRRGTGVAGVPHIDGKGGAVADGHRRRDLELAAAVRPARRTTVDRHLLHAQPDEVEGEPLQRHGGLRRHPRPPHEQVRGHAVLEVELVARDVVALVAPLGDVGVGTRHHAGSPS